MMEQVNVLVRTYDDNPENTEAVKMLNSVRDQWGGLEGPNVGDKVTLVGLFGYQRACCGHSPVERTDIAAEWIGRTVEIGIEYVPELPGMCVNCEGCGNHHHIVDYIFRYGICLPGEMDGIVIGLHEIAPLFQSWDLGEIELDPTVKA